MVQIATSSWLRLGYAAQDVLPHKTSGADASGKEVKLLRKFIDKDSASGILDALLGLLTCDGWSRPAALRVYRDSVYAGDVLHFKTSGSHTMRIDWTKVGALWNSGHSIVVNGAHRYAPAIECAVSQIASTFGRPVSANAYMTPKSGVGSSALLEHADSTIVAAVQIAGSKVWQVSTGSIKLQPRDVLLLAPEVTHAPHAVSGEGSVHISFVLEVSGEIETTQRASMIGNAPTLGEILGLNVDC